MKEPIAMPHSCEVLIDRIDEVLERHYKRLSEQDRIDLNCAAVVLKRLADEDREAIQAEIES